MIVWKWLNDNGTALGVILALIPLVWITVQYILIRRAEEQRVRFTTYHSLIKQLVAPETLGGPMHVDRQVAVIYELRSFKHYFPVTLRILKGVNADWESPPPKPKRLKDELDLAVAYIESRV